MKIVIIHGQSHEGTTCHIARILAEKLNGATLEFFLPQDFNHFCIGCTTCFIKSEINCPHYKQLKPITDALNEADVIILASPVYVYHVTGAMKSFLDHYGYRWMVHRPEAKMFGKQAVCISTAAGAGMKSTNKDMADSTFFWGCARTYKFGVGVQAVSWDEVSSKIRAKVERNIVKLSSKINKRCGKVKPSIKTKVFFTIMRMMQKKVGIKRIKLTGRKRDGSKKIVLGSRNINSNLYIKKEGQYAVAISR